MSSEKKKSKKGLIALIFVIIILLAGYFAYKSFAPRELIEEKGVNLDKNSLPEYLERHQVIQDLPEDSDIILDIGSGTYLINGDDVTLVSEETGEIQLSPEEQDIIINCESCTAEEIGGKGFVSSMIESIEEGEVSISTELTSSEIATKYWRIATKYGSNFLE